MDYVVSDLHGQYNLWCQIKDFLREDDRLICLGDCIDRGSDGLQILIEMVNDNRVILLKGNHEQFLEDWLYCRLYNRLNYELHFAREIWSQNGGDATFKQMQKICPNDESLQMLYDIVKDLPLICEYNNNIILSHAGLSPWREEDYDENNLLWNRIHFLDRWSTDEKYKDVVVVHGHTPVQYLNRFLGISSNNAACRSYAQGHKIDIDLCSFVTGKTCLLNLTTLTPIYFERKDKINE